MPVHDWTRVDAGLFHDFHQSWTVAIKNALNSGGLPPGYFALVEQRVPGPIPDVLTLELAPQVEAPGNGRGAVAVATAPPNTSVIWRRDADIYARKANRVTVRHRHGDVVAVIEIVSPGNKASRAELANLVQKLAEFVRQGIHLLIVDLLPPGKRDSRRVAQAVWDEFEEVDREWPVGKPLTLASFDAGPPLVAYIEPLAVGDRLADMPLFLRPNICVAAPLEATYCVTWEGFPNELKSLLEPPPTNDARET